VFRGDASLGCEVNRLALSKDSRHRAKVIMERDVCGCDIIPNTSNPPNTTTTAFPPYRCCSGLY